MILEPETMDNKMSIVRETVSILTVTILAGNSFPWYAFQTAPSSTMDGMIHDKISYKY